MNIGRPAAVHGVADGRVLGELVLQIHDRPGAADEQDGIPVVQAAHFIRGEQLFATLSSDEFKKTAAAKKNLCGCRSNWRLEAKKSPVVPGK